MSSRVASGATPSTSAHSGFNGCCAGSPPVENFWVICPITYQMMTKPITPARIITRTSPLSMLSMLVEPRLRNRKLVEFEIGPDAMLQGTIIADKLERIGHHAAIDEALVQVGHQHRTHDELEGKRGERLAGQLELPPGSDDIDERDECVRVQHRQHDQQGGWDPEERGQSGTGGQEQKRRYGGIEID